MRGLLWTIIIAAGSLSAARLAEAVQVAIDPDDFGCPGMGYTGVYDLPATTIGIGRGVRTVGAMPEHWYEVYTWPTTIGKFRIADNGDGTFDVETDPAYGGLIGSTSAPEGEINVVFNNVDVEVDAGNYQGLYDNGWWLDYARGNQALRLPKGNSAGNAYRMRWGDVDKGNNFDFVIDNDGVVTIAGVSRPGVTFTGGPNQITFPQCQRIVMTVPIAQLEAQGKNRWWLGNGMVDSADLGGWPETAAFYPLPGTYKLIVHPGGASADVAIPADATGWSGQVAHPYGTFIFTGPAPAATVTEFYAADQSTGSRLFTNSADVNVGIAVSADEGATIDGYLITETDTEPAEGWLPDPPTAYSIAGGEGSKILYAWVKAGSVVAGATADILFSTAVPVVSNVAVTDNGDGTATATWTTGVPAQGGAKYGPASQAGTMPNEVVENAAGTGHSIESQISWPVDQSLCSELRSREDWPTGQPDPTLCTLHLAGFAVERCAPFRFRHRPAQWFSRGCSRERRWIAGS